MKYKNPLERIFKASIYSFNGIFTALKNEQAFRFEFITLLIVCLLSFLLSLGFLRLLILICAWLLVMAFELVNSAVELTFDLIDSNYKSQIKAGKDMLSAAVFLMICVNVLLWILVLVEKFFK